MNEEQKNELVVTAVPGLVAPVATLDDSIQIFKEYERAKTRLLSDGDVLWIGPNGLPGNKTNGKPHIKRSGWRKLARFFGLSLEIKSKNKQLIQDGYMWVYNVRATHPNGAFADAEGVCSSSDAFFTKGGKKAADEENIMLKAQTVAFNRAISDLLGGGEVSAEEIESGGHIEPIQDQQPKHVPSYTPESKNVLGIAALRPETMKKYEDTKFKIKFKGTGEDGLDMWTVLNTSDESKKLHDVQINKNADHGSCDCDGWNFTGTCIHLVIVRQFLTDGKLKNNVELIE